MKILVAESKIENTRRVKDMLSQTQQYAVVEANTANDALTLLQDQQFDCIFIGAHFFGEAHELRAMVTQHDISPAPVVIIAGHVPDKSLEESSLAESPVADSSLTQFSLTEPRVAESPVTESPLPVVSGIFGYVTAPFSVRDLICSIDIARARFEREQKLEREIAQLEQRIATRKLVDKAKAVLMNQGLSEQEAFSRLQKTSMNTRTSLAEVAHAVILMDNVQKGSN